MTKLLEIDGHYLDPDEVVAITKTYQSGGTEFTPTWVYFSIYLRNGKDLRIERMLLAETEYPGPALSRDERLQSLAKQLQVFRDKLLGIEVNSNGRETPIDSDGAGTVTPTG